MDTRLKCLSGTGHFFSLFGHTSKAMMGLRKLPRDQRISKQLSERISLAVSGVNECSYCSWLHTKTALEKGLSQSEIEALLSTEFEDIAPDETTAVLYAQHWADRDGDVTEEARGNVINELGEHRTAEIEAIIRAVYFGNLCCNTVVAYREAKKENHERPVNRFTYLLALPVAGAIKSRSGFRDK